MNSQPANLLLEDRTPPCHNRPPFAEGRWHATGELRASRIHSRNVAAPGKARADWQPVMKPVLRWYPRWFEQRCATHDGVGIGPNNENYPAAHGWNCTGCRWRPWPAQQLSEQDLLRMAAAAQRAAAGPDSIIAREIDKLLE